MKYSREALAICTVAAMILAGCNDMTGEGPKPPKVEPAPKIVPQSDSARSDDVRRIEDADAICYLYSREAISCIPRTKGITLQLNDDDDQEVPSPKAKAPTRQM